MVKEAESLRDFLANGAPKEKPSRFRLNVELAPDVAAALQEIADADGVSVSEAVRRAIANDHFLRGKHREGAKVLLEYPNGGRIKEVVFVGWHAV